MKLGKNGKNRLKIEEKAEILVQNSFKNAEFSWQEELLHPCFKNSFSELVLFFFFLSYYY